MKAWEVPVLTCGIMKECSEMPRIQIVPTQHSVLTPQLVPVCGFGFFLFNLKESPCHSAYQNSSRTSNSEGTRQ